MHISDEILCEVSYRGLLLKFFSIFPWEKTNSIVAANMCKRKCMVVTVKIRENTKTNMWMCTGNFWKTCLELLSQMCLWDYAVDETISKIEVVTVYIVKDWHYHNQFRVYSPSIDASVDLFSVCSHSFFVFLFASLHRRSAFTSDWAIIHIYFLSLVCITQ